MSLLVGLGMSGVTILPNQVLVSRWFHERVGSGLRGATLLGLAASPRAEVQFAAEPALPRGTPGSPR